MPSGDLHRYFLGNSSKGCFKWIHYFDIYERHFERFRAKAPVVLEIGVRGGGSLEMWKFYFGKGARIIGVDINPACKDHEEEDIEIFIGSQDDPALIDKIFAAYPDIDIVIDDGSHEMVPTIASFNLLYEKIRPNGVYLVEDTYTSYRAKNDGGLKREGTFMEFVKDRLDELHGDRATRGVPIPDFARSTDSVCCYDGIVVFERRPQGLRQTLNTKKMSRKTRNVASDSDG